MLETLTRNLLVIPVERFLHVILFGWPFWTALALTLAAERLWPAERARARPAVSIAHDVVWFVYEPLLSAFVVGTYVVMLDKVYARCCASMTLGLPAGTPGWARLVIALTLVDLCFWVQHYVNHKVPLFWRFHAVHHSQTQLNFFTDFRYHVFEYLVRQTFLTLPLLWLRIDPPVIVAVAIVREWYSRFYHGNIRTNLGPLRYVLVTPQSHRVHHSREARHRDRNFGAILSVWDALFRQQYRHYDEYPATGIEDARFPHERAISLKSLLLTPWIQMLYPLRAPRS